MLSLPFFPLRIGLTEVVEERACRMPDGDSMETVEF
jgi:hypothetical protein